jgi:hypothetical protein
MELSTQVSLGNGKAISPPKGWIQDGFTADNPLWLLPKGRVRWYPPGSQGVVLHWSVSVCPLDKRIMEHLLSLMKHEMGDIELDELKPLHPSVIRMPASSLLRARLLEFDNSGPLICVEYGYEEVKEAGFIAYAATESHELGEYQVLGYEGKHPAFDEFLDVAIASIQSFSINQFDAKNASTIADPQAHIVEEGETLRVIASKKWPDLTADEIAHKARQIYAFNLARGIVLKDWEMPPGTTVFLPA